MATEAGPLGRTPQDAPRALPGEPPAALVEEDGWGSLPLGGQRGASPDEVCRERGRGVGPQRHEAFLAALAAQPHDPLLRRHIVDVQPRGLGDPGAGAVEHLQQGSVTKRGGGVAHGSRFEQALHLGHADGLGKSARWPGRAHSGGRVGRHLAFEREESVQSAHRDDRTGCRCRRQSGRAVAALAQGPEEGRDVLLPHRRGVGDPERRQVTRPLHQVPPIGLEGVLRDAPFDLEVREP